MDRVVRSSSFTSELDLVSCKMSCIDISEDSITPPDEPDKLCNVCQQIDFVSLTNKLCCEEAFNHCHFHIGQIWNVFNKLSCPGCRLIAYGILSAGAEAPVWDLESMGEQAITLNRHYPKVYSELSQENRQRDSTGQGHITSAIHLDDNHVIGIAPLESLLKIDLSQSSTPSSGAAVGAIVKSEESDPKAAHTDGRHDHEDFSKDFLIRGRSVPPVLDIKLVKRWMHLCNTHHSRCHLSDRNVSKKQRIRLVNVEDWKVVSASLEERYVALSYVWGSNTAPMLRKDTVQRYSMDHGLLDPEIPQTILDTIRLVRDIGERYLWVDTLCIVQDDESDKLPQLSIMGDIFGCAYLVIAAATGYDAFAGLPGTRNRDRWLLSRKERINGTDFTTVKPPLMPALSKSTWITRGWTFQEVVMARRVLVFTMGQVYWSCRRGSWQEDLTCESLTAGLVPDHTNSFWDRKERQEMCRTLQYCTYVAGFSGRDLKEEGDKIWAFSSILKMQTSRFPQGFISCLPYEKLDATILWFEAGDCGMVHELGPLGDWLRDITENPLDLRHPFRENISYASLGGTRYPSWSWLSTHSKVSFIDPCGDAIASEVSWHNRPHWIGDATPGLNANPIQVNRVLANNLGQRGDTLLLSSAFREAVEAQQLLHLTAQVAKLRFVHDGKIGKPNLGLKDGIESCRMLIFPARVLKAILHSMGVYFITNRGWGGDRNDERPSALLPR